MHTFIANISDLDIALLNRRSLFSLRNILFRLVPDTDTLLELFKLLLEDSVAGILSHILLTFAFFGPFLWLWDINCLLVDAAYSLEDVFNRVSAPNHCLFPDKNKVL